MLSRAKNSPVERNLRPAANHRNANKILHTKIGKYNAAVYGLIWRKVQTRHCVDLAYLGPMVGC